MVPVMVVLTILTALVTIVGSTFGGGRWFGYYPPKIWARLWCWMAFVRVTVRRRGDIDPKTSYVFVANHQGAYDIFAIYGWLGHNFRWMMKQSLRKIPFVGYACYKCGQIFVDKSSRAALKKTMERAEQQLSGGMSLVVFPEGSRTPDGKIHQFRRGAFLLADEFRLPVVPVTIDGAYRVMPRTAKLPRPGHIVVTIHEPILPPAGGYDLDTLKEQSAAAIASALIPNKFRPR
ncbi:MAG: 1-acyl-sn-glycerol-3-phosphate acyltransferase [Clostridium sp.]|nr:1-acyl-sn-glycerol-3-phosphate acyltransferase [Clostridium sp.]